MICMYCTYMYHVQYNTWYKTSKVCTSTYRHLPTHLTIPLIRVQTYGLLDYKIIEESREVRILVTPSPCSTLTWYPKAAGYSLRLGGIFITPRARDGIDQTNPSTVPWYLRTYVRQSSGMNRRAGADVTAFPPPNPLLALEIHLMSKKLQNVALF